MAQVKPIPDGYHSITPSLVVSSTPKAIDFYKRVFGATELYSMAAPDGRILHAEIRVGDSIVMLNDEMPEMGSHGPAALKGSPVTLHFYCEDADAVWARAIAAGATVTMPISDVFWGDRYGVVVDPFGHIWSIATHKRDLSPDEMKRAMADAMAKQKSK